MNKFQLLFKKTIFENTIPRGGGFIKDHFEKKKKNQNFKIQKNLLKKIII
jgi:hypothetical protein